MSDPFESRPSSGPLVGLRVAEFAGLGPAPHACMLLSDMGAEIVRVDRPGSVPPDPTDATVRGRLGTVALNLKSADDVEAALQLIEKSDILIEGFRPGVMERLGLGPDVALARNPRLIYGRMTGWGQTGPLAQAAGHDINYISLSGALAGIGPRDGKPVPPLNLVGDYGGGSLYLTVGLLAALLERTRSGLGQVVDAAICDGVASLMALPNWLLQQRGSDAREERGSNVGDGGRFFYNSYACADGRYVSVGAFEPQFYQALCEGMGVADDPDFKEQKLGYLESRNLIARAETIFRSKTSAEWCAIFAVKDACFTPVLWPSEAPHHPHNAERGIFVELGGVPQPAPAPRFGRTPGRLQGLTPIKPLQIADVLAAWDWEAANGKWRSI
ncbi:CoA transferase (plasmid) [Sphingomonas paeninsulae]|uniref:CoA transferase n=1 Tax=Sphingomonas paeninsulae TaxID=2319844 RepID=A0A494TGD7_SPHPE|nr:CaiB/BaiF CoA-transferase family protein [Sphingomonas paeninsulae]AYJ84881.1 CoA transferase [Sphingomonas paeninsulae]